MPTTELQWTKRLHIQHIANMQLKIDIEKEKKKVCEESHYKVYERKENWVLRKIIDTNLVGTKYIVQCQNCETNTEPSDFDVNNICDCSCGDYYEYEDFFRRQDCHCMPRPVEQTPSYAP